jgi:predicted CoA-binding protein
VGVSKEEKKIGYYYFEYYLTSCYSIKDLEPNYNQEQEKYYGDQNLEIKVVEYFVRSAKCLQVVQVEKFEWVE